MKSYRLHQAEKTQHHWLKFIPLLLVIPVAIGVWFLLPHHNNRKVDPSPTTSAKAEQVSVTGVESKVLFAGDVYWGRRMNAWAQASPLKEAYPFSGLSDFHKDKYDAWVANLECPTVPGYTPTQNEEENLLMFNCSTTYLPQLAKWFDIVSIANNHTDNQGADGFAATREQLDANKIQYFGHYDPAVTNEVCEVVSLPVRVAESDENEEPGSLPFALCGYHGVFKIPSTESLAVMQKYSKYMPVIAYPHMGVEYQPSADKLRTEVFHKMIDNGADAVLAGHPHWVQNSEAYKGKLIVYSMGNFIFDQQADKEVTRSAVITLDLTTDESVDKKDLAAWLKLGPTCKQFADTCLAEAEKQNLTRLPLKLTFGMIAGDSSNKLTKPADTTVTQAVADRLSWNATATQLSPAGVPYAQTTAQ